MKRPPFYFFLLLLLLTHYSLPIKAGEKTSQMWSFEMKGGAFWPRGSVTRNFIDCCSPTGALEFGLLIDSKWGAELGAGFMDTTASAVGTGSQAGAISQDRFNLLLIPIHASFLFRADFKENQFLVPYAKTGFDSVFFRENVQGVVTKGLKQGVHGAAGLQILLDTMDELAQSFEADVGVNDVYLTLEGRYAWIDNFGRRGLDLSHWMFSGGFLFEF